MRYKVLFFIALVALIGVVGCKNPTNDTDNKEPTTTTVTDGTTTTTTTTDPKIGVKTILKKSIVKTPSFYSGGSSGSRPGDIVFVPFSGSGTECAMAQREGRKYIGFDVCKKYVDMGNERCRKEKAQLSLFDQFEPATLLTPVTESPTLF